jgi:hypothetical protein
MQARSKIIMKVLHTTCLRKHLLKKLIVLICFGLPAFVSAQSNLYADSINRKIVKDECDDRIFTSEQHAPYITGGEKSLADSLLGYLNRKNVVIKGKATYEFVVTKNSELLNIDKLSGQISSENELKEGLLFYSNMWMCALQNSYKVCAYVRLETEFKKGRILLKINP